MINTQTAYEYWDMLWWGIGRFFLGAFFIIAIFLFIAWIFEHVLAPIGETIKTTWWRWTKKCPKCFPEED